MNIPAIGLDLFVRTPQACPFDLTMRLYAPKSHALSYVRQVLEMAGPQLQ